MNVHKFRDDLAWSTRGDAEAAWQSFWRRLFPALLEALPISDIALQRRGVDRLLLLPGRALLVDEKERRGRYDDLLLEIWSRDKVPGWAVDDKKINHLIAYAVPALDRCCVFSAPLLRTTTRRELQSWKERCGGWREARNDGYVTLNIPVPLDVFLAAYAATRCVHRFGGDGEQRGLL